MGEKFSYAGFSGFSRSQLHIIKALIEWNYQEKKGSATNIAIHIEYSQAQTYVALRFLKARGIVNNTQRGSWFIRNSVKEQMIKNLTQPSTEEVKASKDRPSSSVE